MALFAVFKLLVLLKKKNIVDLLLETRNFKDHFMEFNMSESL